LSLRSEAKASRLPSGEKAGASEDFFALVSRRGSPPAVSASQISVSNAFSSQFASRTT
jgi:hypothetical protein